MLFSIYCGKIKGEYYIKERGDVPPKKGDSPLFPTVGRLGSGLVFCFFYVGNVL